MASCWGWRSEETGWLVLNDLGITREEEKSQQRQQEPPTYEFLSAAANYAITQLATMLKVSSFYSLHYMSVMEIPKFLVKNLQEQNDCLMLTRKTKPRKPHDGSLGKASFPHIS